MASKKGRLAKLTGLDVGLLCRSHCARGYHGVYPWQARIVPMVVQFWTDKYEVHPRRISMTDDERCCGTGTCMIDAQGRCWCGQQWNGDTMCAPKLEAQTSEPPAAMADTDAPAP